MPKVLRIINRFNLGGPTYNAAYLAKYLGNDFETLLIGGEIDETEENSQHILESLGLTPLIIPEMRRNVSLYQDYITYKKIRKLIADYQPDIVHTHASKAGALGRLAAYRARVPVIVHTFHGHVFHSYFSPLKTYIYKSIERFLAKRTTKIIAISEIQKKELSEIHKIAPPEKFEVIPLGFDLHRFHENRTEKRTEFRNRYELNEDELAVGIIGRLVPIKNHFLFLKAIKYVHEKSNRTIKAFIIGDGEERKNIENEARKLDLKYASENSPGVTLIFTSWIKNIDVANAGLDIICLTSLNEGTPVSLIEAQASNKPIVTTNVGGIKDIIQPYQTGFVKPLDDEEAFCKALLSLVNNDDLRHFFGSNGWRFVEQKFSYLRLVKDMRELYLRLLN